MNVNLNKYAHLKVCVAVSGGRDSMALLHYLNARAEQYDITVTALNCDHRMRPITSERDSAFVADYCEKAGIPLSRYVADRKFADEGSARMWRLFECYLKEAENCDAIATAHHLGDNAETVLFNLARGTSLAGMEGITDTDMSQLANKPFRLIRPFIACSRAEIEEYIAQNGIPYVDDETNSDDDYTRNKIRHNVLPALESAVPGAAKAIYRFSRQAAEDEEYFARQIKPLIFRRDPYGNYILHCEERVIFRRAAAEIIARWNGEKDYTTAHLDRLYELQFADNGKKFEFLHFTAFKEEGRICIADSALLHSEDAEIPFADFLSGETKLFCGQTADVCAEQEEQSEQEYLDEYGGDAPRKTLYFDKEKIPATAVVRFARAGDKFTKFGGGTKKLGDYFTDRKVPLRLRKSIPLLCDGSDVLLIFGVEISEKVKTDPSTQEILCAIANDYRKL